MADIKEITARASEYLSSPDLSLIEETYRGAQGAQHPDLNQSLETALILVGLQMDAESIAASLLLGLPQDSKLSQKAIQSKFGEGVRKLVEGVNKISSFSWVAPDETQAENLRKMFLAMVEDVRVIIISLANRLQVMRNSKKLPPGQQTDLAKETMEVYAPLAHRLGIGELRYELEDISFQLLYPERYKEIAGLLDVKKTEWEKHIAQAMTILKDEFARAGLKAEISGRPKSVRSIHAKMKKYAKQGKEYSEIYDLMAVRVLLETVPDCYNALGIVHHLWHPLPGQFDDYIANPKGNLYQSLHTTVIATEGKPLEIQIRTYEMHRTSEYGVAAHWRYKEGAKKDNRFEEKMAWFRQIMEWQQDVSGAVFVESLKTDIFKDQVYVFTPNGEIKELPQGSTSLDFAYRVHTELGHRCTGGKVNGRLVPLTYQLQNGDVVEILSTKADRGPSLDWLNPESGYVRSGHAKEKIRAWFRKRDRAENIDRGRELFEKAMRRLGTNKSAEEVADLFEYKDANEFLIALGVGDISVNQIGPRMAPKEEEPELPPVPAVAKRTQGPTGIQVLGVGDLLTHLAPCCNPIPGDEIIGFVTRTKGVTIHRKNCPNIMSGKDKERMIDVAWGHRQQVYSVPIIISAENRVGLLKDITNILSEAKVNIVSISSESHDDGTVSIFLTVEISDIGHLSQMFVKLERVRGVNNVSRIAEDAKDAKADKKRGMIHLGNPMKAFKRRK
ncbi:MAG: bifunctional (p)ppGpp synthetase/guanosine-3',5'-bis(diphosphate) 3'-pyrophosphohydrolase [Dehalococcoidia bacterium]|nr:bifunctional (p)ppGpp synthetase/guanosine-3',5'-bis(diphosphate) 3'-pyrophosphohydrolase [Dehalococcoidia bacterium]